MAEFYGAVLVACFLCHIKVYIVLPAFLIMTHQANTINAATLAQLQNTVQQLRLQYKHMGSNIVVENANEPSTGGHTQALQHYFMSAKTATDRFCATWYKQLKLDSWGEGRVCSGVSAVPASSFRVRIPGFDE
jgi:hypothetical protein